MKTPEEMAEEYAKEHHMGGWEYEASIPAWLAGYQAAQHKDKAVNRTHLAWKLAEDYGAVKWLKHKDPKRFGNTERDYEYTIARDGFYQGYQAAKISPEKQDSCEHILDMEKMVDVTSSSGWISVKERLPDIYQRVLILIRGRIFISSIEEEYGGEYRDGVIRFWDGDWDWPDVTHWMPLPEAPKGESWAQNTV